MRVILRSERPLRFVRWAERAFLGVGLLLLGYCVAVFVQAKYYQAKTARNFENQLRQRAAAPPAEAPVAPHVTVVPPPSIGSVIGRLRAPRIGLSVMVIEGDSGRELKLAAGHIPGTALPGQAGNIGIAAHRDTFFRPLRSIQRNDTIDLETLNSVRRYRVESTEVVSPSDVQVLNPVGHDVLTLVTCFPFDYIGHAPKRFIVRAERVD